MRQKYGAHNVLSPKTLGSDCTTMQRYGAHTGRAERTGRAGAAADTGAGGWGHLRAGAAGRGEAAALEGIERDGLRHVLHIGRVAVGVVIAPEVGGAAADSLCY